MRSLEGYRRKNGEPTVTQEGYVAYHDGKLAGTLTTIKRNSYNNVKESHTNNQRSAASGQGVGATTDNDMLSQSVRIINRLRASREAGGTDGTDTGGDSR